MSFQRVQQVRVAIPREAVWGALMTPDVWPVMDDAVQRCTPVAEDGTVLADVAAGEAGGLAVGQRIMVVPRAVARGTVHALTAPPARVVEVVEGFRFAWQQDQPGGFTRVKWSLIDSADGRGTIVERRIEAQGPLGSAAGGAAFGGLLDSDLSKVGARLFEMLAEEAEHDAAQALPLVVIAGGTGFLGTRLAHTLLARGRRVVVLSRKRSTDALVPRRQWDGVSQGEWSELFADPAGVSVVNMVGPRMFKKATAQKMAELRVARVTAARALNQCARKAKRVTGWIHASALALTTDANAEDYTAHTAPDWAPESVPGMAALLKEWEAVAPDNAVVVRTAPVLGSGMPGLAGLKAVAAARVRPAEDPWLSWIHVEDWARIVVHALLMQEEHAAAVGRGFEALRDRVVVAAAPEPLRLSEALQLLGSASGKGWEIQVPVGLLRAAGELAGFEPELLLTGVKARTNAAEVLGPVFEYPNFERAAASFR